MQNQVDPAPQARFSKLAVVSLCVTAPWYFYAIGIMYLSVEVLAPLLGMGGFCDRLGLILPAGLLVLLMLIAGIVGGHVASIRIEKSGGALRGQWLARATYIMGYFWVAFFIVINIIAAIIGPTLDQ